MDPITGAALIGAGSQIVGGMIGAHSAGNLNFQNREWQREMSNSQYQRGVEDMRKAGLNPLMMYGKGSMAANTPSVAPQTVPGQLAGAGLANAGKELSEIPMLKAQKAVLDQTKSTGRSQEALNDANAQDAIESQNLKYYQGLTEQNRNLNLENERNISQLMVPWQQREILSRIHLNEATGKKLGADYEATEAGIPGISAGSFMKNLERQAAGSAVKLFQDKNYFDDASPGIHDNLEDAWHRYIFRYQQSMARKNSAKSP
ncbi:MAG: DNA pilot protein [Microviridae sp.]|nr:MAG: DNA pilot protein [Microviridae sp.]